MQLVHHTTVYAMQSILKDNQILPVFDYVWLTKVLEGEMTAGMSMPEEHRARIVIDIPENEVFWVHDMIDELPHLNFELLNMVTNTEPWYLSEKPISQKYFTSVDIIKNGEWKKYE